MGLGACVEFFCFPKAGSPFRIPYRFSRSLLFREAGSCEVQMTHTAAVTFLLYTSLVGPTSPTRTLALGHLEVFSVPLVWLLRF